jgi:hypothetical protein
MKYKSTGNVDKGHLKPMEDAKTQPYEIKGYTQNTRMQKPKQTLQKKNLSCCYKNTSTMAGLIVARMQ